MNDEYVEPKGRIEHCWVLAEGHPETQDATLVFRVLGTGYEREPLALLRDRKALLRMRDAIQQHISE